MAGKADDPRAVEDVDRRRANCLDHFSEARELLAGESLVLVRDGQMGRDAGDFDARERGDFARLRGGLALPDADAPHAGVEREVNGESLGAGERGIGAGFLSGGHRGDEPLPDDLQPLLRKRRA